MASVTKNVPTKQWTPVGITYSNRVLKEGMRDATRDTRYTTCKSSYLPNLITGSFRSSGKICPLALLNHRLTSVIRTSAARPLRRPEIMQNNKVPKTRIPFWQFHYVDCNAQGSGSDKDASAARALFYWISSPTVSAILPIDVPASSFSCAAIRLFTLKVCCSATSVVNNPSSYAVATRFSMSP